MANNLWSAISNLFKREQKDSNTGTSSTGAGTADSLVPKTTITSYDSGIKATPDYARRNMQQAQQQFQLARQAGVSSQDFYTQYANGTRWLDSANQTAPKIRQYDSGQKVTREYAQNNLPEARTQFNLAKQAGVSAQDFYTAYANGTRWVDDNKPRITSYQTGRAYTKADYDANPVDAQNQFNLAREAGWTADEFYKAFASGTRWREGGGTLREDNYEQTPLERLRSSIDDSEWKNRILDRRLQRLQEKYGTAVFDDDFVGQFRANFGMGRISEELNQAVSDYMDNPTEENWQYITSLRILLDNMQKNNTAALDDENVQAGWLSKTIANYLPQFWNQTKASAAPIAMSVAAGALVAGIPGAFGGLKVGTTIGSGLYSYDNMRGAAFLNLIETGVDESVAKKAAEDEAIISSLVEMSDTAVDMFTMLPGISTAKKFVADKAGKIAVGELTKTLAKYGLNVGQEYGEEWFQEIISMANQARIARGDVDGGPGALIQETIRLVNDIFSGNAEEESAQAREAGKGGAIIGAVMGGVHIGTGAVYNQYTNSQIVKSLDRIEAESKQEGGLSGYSDKALKKMQTAAENKATKNDTAAGIIKEELERRASYDSVFAKYDSSGILEHAEADATEQERDEVDARNLEKLDKLNLDDLAELDRSSVLAIAREAQRLGSRNGRVLAFERLQTLREEAAAKETTTETPTEEAPVEAPAPEAVTPEPEAAPETEAPAAPTAEEAPAAAAKETSGSSSYWDDVISAAEEGVPAPAAPEPESAPPSANPLVPKVYTLKELRQMTSEQLAQLLIEAEQSGNKNASNKIRKELELRQQEWEAAGKQAQENDEAWDNWEKEQDAGKQQEQQETEETTEATEENVSEEPEEKEADILIDEVEEPFEFPDIETLPDLSDEEIIRLYNEAVGADPADYPGGHIEDLQNALEVEVQLREISDDDIIGWNKENEERISKMREALKRAYQRNKEDGTPIPNVVPPALDPQNLNRAYAIAMGEARTQWEREEEQKKRKYAGIDSASEDEKKKFAEDELEKSLSAFYERADKAVEKHAFAFKKRSTKREFEALYGSVQALRENKFNRERNDDRQFRGLMSANPSEREIAYSTALLSEIRKEIKRTKPSFRFIDADGVETVCYNLIRVNYNGYRLDIKGAVFYNTKTKDGTPIVISGGMQAELFDGKAKLLGTSKWIPTGKIKANGDPAYVSGGFSALVGRYTPGGYFTRDRGTANTFTIDEYGIVDNSETSFDEHYSGIGDVAALFGRALYLQTTDPQKVKDADAQTYTNEISSIADEADRSDRHIKNEEWSDTMREEETGKEVTKESGNPFSGFYRARREDRAFASNGMAGVNEFWQKFNQDENDQNAAGFAGAAEKAARKAFNIEKAGAEGPSDYESLDSYEADFADVFDDELVTLSTYLQWFKKNYGLYQDTNEDPDPFTGEYIQRIDTPENGLRGMSYFYGLDERTFGEIVSEVESEMLRRGYDPQNPPEFINSQRKVDGMSVDRKWTSKKGSNGYVDSTSFINGKGDRIYIEGTNRDVHFVSVKKLGHAAENLFNFLKSALGIKDILVSSGAFDYYDLAAKNSKPTSDTRAAEGANGVAIERSKLVNGKKKYSGSIVTNAKTPGNLTHETGHFVFNLAEAENEDAAVSLRSSLITRIIPKNEYEQLSAIIAKRYAKRIEKDANNIVQKTGMRKENATKTARDRVVNSELFTRILASQDITISATGETLFLRPYTEALVNSGEFQQILDLAAANAGSESKSVRILGEVFKQLVGRPASIEDFGKAYQEVRNGTASSDKRTSSEGRRTGDFGRGSGSVSGTVGRGPGQSGGRDVGRGIPSDASQDSNRRGTLSSEENQNPSPLPGENFAGAKRVTSESGRRAVRLVGENDALLRIAREKLREDFYSGGEKNSPKTRRNNFFNDSGQLWTSRNADFLKHAIRVNDEQNIRKFSALVEADNSAMRKALAAHGEDSDALLEDFAADFELGEEEPSGPSDPTKPTRDEVIAYAATRKHGVRGERFFSWMEKHHWRDNHGTPINAANWQWKFGEWELRTFAGEDADALIDLVARAKENGIDNLDRDDRSMYLHYEELLDEAKEAQIAGKRLDKFQKLVLDIESGKAKKGTFDRPERKQTIENYFGEEGPGYTRSYSNPDESYEDYLASIGETPEEDIPESYTPPQAEQTPPSTPAEQKARAKRRETHGRNADRAPLDDAAYRATFGEGKQVPDEKRADMSAPPLDVTAEEREMAARDDYQSREARAAEIAAESRGRAKIDYGESAAEIFMTAEDVANKSFPFESDPQQKPVSDSLKKLKDVCRSVANGSATGYELAKLYLRMKSDAAFGAYYDEKTASMMENVVDAYEKAEESPSPYAQQRYGFALRNALNTLNTRLDRAETARTQRKEIQRNINKYNGDTKGRKSMFKHGLNRLFNEGLQFLQSMQINPTNFFRGLIGGFDKNSGNFGYAFADRLDKATRVNQTVIAESQSDLIELAKKLGKKFDAFAKGDDVKTINLFGKDYSLSQQEMVSLYKTIRTLIASEHLGEQRLDTLKGFSFAKKDGSVETIDFSGSDSYLGRETLMDMQRALWGELGDPARQYLDTVDPILERLGKRNAEVEYTVNGNRPRTYKSGDYITLRYASDPNNAAELIRSDDDTVAFGFTQERTRAGGGYCLIEPVTTVVDRYINQSANHIAYAELADELTTMNKGGALSKMMEDSFGKRWGQWMTNFINDMANINPKERTDGISSMLRAGRQAVQTGALVGSVSVPIKQISSYWAAAGKLRMSTLVKAYRIKNMFGSDYGYAKDNPLLKYRKIDGFDPTLSEVMNSKGLWSKLKSGSKLLQQMEKWIPAMDIQTVDNLFHACAIEVAEDNPGIDPKSKEFQTLVTEKFEDVVVSTQPIFTRNARAEYARTDNEFIKLFSMFRTQQTQNLNRIAQSIGEYRRAKGTAGEMLAFSEATETLKGQVMSAVSLALLTSVADFALHKLRKYKDDDDEIAADKIISRIGLNAVETAAGTLWFGSDLMKWTIDKVNEARGVSSNEFYSVNMGIVSTIGNVMDSLSNLIENPSLANARYAAGYIAQTMGIPLNNAYQLVNSAVMYSKDVYDKISDGKTSGYDDILRFLDKEIVASRWDSVYDKTHVLVNAALNGNQSKADRVFSSIGDQEKLDAAMNKEVKTRYLEGAMTRDESENLLYRYTSMSREDTEKRNDFWEFVKENPKHKDVSESFVQKYNSYAEPASIPVNVFYDAMQHYKETKSIDYDGDSKADVTKQQQVVEYINGLHLSKEQKDALWLAFGYSTTSKAFKNRPWK